MSRGFSQTGVVVNDSKYAPTNVEDANVQVGLLTEHGQIDGLGFSEPEDVVAVIGQVVSRQAMDKYGKSMAVFI
jgi:hypothetical protein